jgi:hypothetical protein
VLRRTAGSLARSSPPPIGAIETRLASSQSREVSDLVEMMVTFGTIYIASDMILKNSVSGVETHLMRIRNTRVKSVLSLI